MCLFPHVALQFVDRSGFRSPHDVERDRLVRVAAKAFHFEIAIARIECVTERGRWLRRTLKSEHAFVPSLDGEAVSGLARLSGTLCRRPDRSAVNALA